MRIAQVPLRYYEFKAIILVLLVIIFIAQLRELMSTFNSYIINNDGCVFVGKRLSNSEYNFIN